MLHDSGAIEVEKFGRFVIYDSRDQDDPCPFYAAGKGTKDTLMDKQDNVVCARTVEELRNRLLVL